MTNFMHFYSIKKQSILPFQFSSIYFRNVTFFQVPPYFEFDDRYEILFQYVYTDEGSNKVEPFDIRVKNNNYTRNPVFRMEMSR